MQIDFRPGSRFAISGYEVEHPVHDTVIKALTGGEIKIRKSGVARLTIDPERMQGRLDWLLAPRNCRG